jgi:hypothetical protein
MYSCGKHVKLCVENGRSNEARQSERLSEELSRRFGRVFPLNLLKQLQSCALLEDHSPTLIADWSVNVHELKAHTCSRCNHKFNLV